MLTSIACRLSWTPVMTPFIPPASLRRSTSHVVLSLKHVISSLTRVVSSLNHVVMYNHIVKSRGNVVLYLKSCRFGFKSCRVVFKSCRFVIELLSYVIELLTYDIWYVDEINPLQSFLIIHSCAASQTNSSLHPLHKNPSLCAPSSLWQYPSPDYPPKTWSKVVG